jgi:hypothetical protein
MEVLGKAQQYSKVIKQTNNTVPYSSDSETILEIFQQLGDVIPNDGYYPFYSRYIRQLGTRRFMELANKARAGSDSPARLFCWMLKNNGIVR